MSKFIVNENDDWKFWWDSFILIIAIWNSLSIPVAVAFTPDWSVSLPYILIDQFTNVLFVIDIIIAFNTSYYDVEGEEIRKHSKIAEHYLKGAFLIDLVSTIPFDLITASLKITAILKVIRIQRLTKIINKLSVEEETKAVSN